jgi:hypothetical protein
VILEGGLFRARDDIIQILRERLVGEMAMTINHVAMVACRAPAALAALMCLKPRHSKRDCSSASPVSSVVESLIL